MVVQHNIQAMNANRMLNVTSNAQSKSTEKLSSGYKINRAADDAAGLSISEKMRKQIRGLDQASSNAEDGISAVQTAEGALTEVHDMLQRMNELAVQAANGTNSESDRQSIQDEIDQLSTEIDRVSETTKFNETYLLKGDNSGTATNTLNIKDAGITEGTFDSTGKIMTLDLSTGKTVNVAGTDYTVAATSGVSLKASDGTSAITATGFGTMYNGKFTAFTSADEMTGALLSGQTIYKATTGNAEAVAGTDFKFTSSTSVSATELANAAKYALMQANSIGDTGKTAAVAVGGSGAATTLTITAGTSSTNAKLAFNLHVGADADMTNKIGVSINEMNTKYLGINGVSVVDDSGTAATYAIDSIAEAVSKVSSQRSALGAIQNRLEHTVNNLDNVVENTTSAESRIRDTDMAEEMVNYSKTNILAQAGQSMLAQANSSNQGVLSLLQ